MNCISSTVVKVCYERPTVVTLKLTNPTANQNNPLWPLLQPSRAIDVILVNDNSADTDDNWPNGTEILHTYTLAKSVSPQLTKMPYIPPVSTFMDQNLYRRAAFFGCYDTTKATIIFLPNTNYTAFESNPASSKFDYTKEETEKMIQNGNLVATQGSDKEWATCLGCGIMHKNVGSESKKVLDKCKACLDKYCVAEPKS
jgi:lysophospholipase